MKLIIQKGLKSRTMSIRIEDIISPERKLIVGVPHRSILRPLLLLLFVN